MNLRLFPTHESGGHGASRARRLAHGAVPLLVAAVLSGCATKGDIRDVRQDLTRLQARQDSIYRLLQSQNREILDSLQVTTERLLNVRGELADQLTQLQDQLVQVGQLTGQVQVRLNQFDQQLASLVGQAAATGAGAATGGDEPGGAGAAAGANMAQTYYEIGQEQMGRGNAQTARQAFMAVVDTFPDHPAAPDALRQVGETHVMEGELDEALAAFDEVVRRYQNSDAAPRALYRAGVIAEQQGYTDRARQYYRRVVSGYPASDARRLAEAALDRIG